MKTTLHKADSRGAADHGWLKARHSFSFADYHDPERMGFGLLRVLNDDVVAPGQGFGTHPHRDMEIVTIPLSGALRHKDSMGNESVIRAGEVQRMSAGSGVLHSERNASAEEPVNLLQIWVYPDKRGIAPGYGQKKFDVVGRRNAWQTVVAPGGENGAIDVNQNTRFSLARLDAGRVLAYRLPPGQGAYVFVIAGAVGVGEHVLGARDGLGIEQTETFAAAAAEESELLVVEVPMQ